MSDKVKMKSTINTSEGSAPYIEALYESYLEDPNSVSKDWKIYFETLPKNTDSEKDISHKDVIEKFKISEEGELTQINLLLINLLIKNKLELFS